MKVNMIESKVLVFEKGGQVQHNIGLNGVVSDVIMDCKVKAEFESCVLHERTGTVPRVPVNQENLNWSVQETNMVGCLFQF